MFLANDGIGDGLPSLVVIGDHQKLTPVHGGDVGSSHGSGGFFFAGPGHYTIEYITQPQHGTLSWGGGASGQSVGYIPTQGYTGLDFLSYKLVTGGLESKPVEVWFNVNGSGSTGEVLPPGAGVTYFRPDPVGASSYTAAETLFRPANAPAGTTLALGQQAQHGTVAFDTATGAYTYTPDAATGGDLYLGWDFFSYVVTSPTGVARTVWVQLDVGAAKPPPIVPEPESDWQPQPFNGTISALYNKLTVVQAKRDAVLSKLASLGERWHTIDANAGEPADQVVSGTQPAIDALDAAQSAYLTYQDAWIELNANAASYQSTYQAYFDNWNDPETYDLVLMGIQRLPRDIGGLRPNPDYMERVTDALADFGDGAAFQSNLAGTVFTVAEQAHKNLERAELVLGLASGGVYSMASLTTKAGLAALVKTVAKNYVTDQIASAALTPVMTAAMSMAQQAGIPINPVYLQAGLLALQATACVKGVKPLCVDGQCFVAGTGVVVGFDADGTPITRAIEDIQVGDEVVSRSQYVARDDLDVRRVQAVFARTSDHVRVVTVAGDDGNVETIRTTDEHPFFVKGRSWTEAHDLAAGDQVQESDGSWQTVRHTDLETYADGVTVYNIEVEGDHTYFVEDGDASADAMWVHNYCAKNTFFGRLKGKKPVAFTNARATPRTFTQMTPAQNAIIRNAFDGPKPGTPGAPTIPGTGGVRGDYIQWVAQNHAAELIAGGLKPGQVKYMAANRHMPKDWGFEVHHRVPSEGGGTNDFSNLIVMRKSPYHDALSREYGILTQGLEEGKTRTIDFPLFEGKVIYNGK